MRIVLFLCLLAAPLASCGQVHVASPTQVAGASADQSYITAVTFGMQRVAAGKMSREEFTKLEQAAYAALLLVRSGVATAETLAQFNGATTSLKGEQ